MMPNFSNNNFNLLLRSENCTCLGKCTFFENSCCLDSQEGKNRIREEMSHKADALQVFFLALCRKTKMHIYNMIAINAYHKYQLQINSFYFIHSIIINEDIRMNMRLSIFG